jgi:hypothetical protein
MNGMVSRETMEKIRHQSFTFIIINKIDGVLDWHKNRKKKKKNPRNF